MTICYNSFLNIFVLFHHLTISSCFSFDEIILSFLEFLLRTCRWTNEDTIYEHQNQNSNIPLIFENNLKCLCN